MSKSLKTRFMRLPGQPSVLRQHISRASTREHTPTHTPHDSRFQAADCPVSRLFRTSPRQHTHRHSHSHHKTPVLFCSLLGRAPCCSPTVFPSNCLPAPFPCRTRLVNTITGELTGTLRVPRHTVCSEFRHTPSFIHLLVDLRLTPIISSHSSQTRKHQVAGGQPSNFWAVDEVYRVLAVESKLRPSWLEKVKCSTPGQLKSVFSLPGSTSSE